jgi:hypothetical protein
MTNFLQNSFRIGARMMAEGMDDERKGRVSDLGYTPFLHIAFAFMPYSSPFGENEGINGESNQQKSVNLLFL